MQWGDSSPYFIDVYDITSAQFTLSLPKRCERSEGAFYDVLAKKKHLQDLAKPRFFQPISWCLDLGRN